MGRYLSIVVRGVAVALVAAALGAGTVSAAPAASGLEQPAPPAGQNGAQPLISVVPAPAVPPEAAPPDLPPVPSRFTEQLGSFTMSMEVVASASPSQVGLLASPGCVTDSVFKRGMKLVYRFEVYDMDNKVRVTSVDGSTTQVKLPDGSTVPANFVPRGPPGTAADTAPWMWTAVWQIPTDYSLGPVLYTVEVAAADGRTASIQPTSLAGQPIQTGVPLVVAGTYPTIIP